ncbi:MAG: hypothetical protein CL908_08950 [Deltaproteobacteria bacterium]|jgi:putative acetyltransferase|nr:hypothetical protein [Deltaproteobacteria bacterium]
MPAMGEERARRWADASSEERVVRAIDGHEVWVAEVDGVPVGWVEVDRDRVEGIYVHPRLAGSGIGSTLLGHAEALIRAAGFPSAALEASWNAEEFYLRRGYEAQGPRPEEAGRPMRKPLHGAAP